MLDPTTASRDRLSESGRWGGYAEDFREEPGPVTESGGIGRWLPWLVLLVIAVIAVAFLVTNPA